MAGFPIGLVLLPLLFVGSFALTAHEELNLNAGQKKALEAFKNDPVYNELHPLFKKDVVLAKFLRKNNYQTSAAVQMLKNVIAWRIEHKIREILSETSLEEGKKKFLSSITETDLQGRQICYINGGHWVLQQAISKGEEVKLERTNYRLFEETTRLTLKNVEEGKPYAQWVLLMDYNHWSIATGFCLECLGVLTRIATNLDAMWPGFVSKIITVNTPEDFHLFLKVIRPLFGEELQDSMEVYGRNKTSYLPQLSKSISPEVFTKLTTVPFP